jgi:hypothetical protein
MKNRFLFYRGYLQGLFIALRVTYVWFFPDRSLRAWPRLARLEDIFGIGSLTLGATLRIWSVSHPGRQTPARTIKAEFCIPGRQW